MNVDEIILWTTSSSVVFQLIAKVSTGILKRLVPTWNITDETKEKVTGVMFSRYIISTINAIFTGAWGVYKLSLGSSRWITPYGNNEVVSIMNGYFLADFLLDDWTSDLSNVFHHVIGLSSITGLLLGNIGETFMPDVQLMEISTFLLNMMWFMRTFNKTNNTSYKCISVLFLITFFILRIIYYPYVLLKICFDYPHEWIKLNLFMKCVIWSLWVLQVYWFRKIVALAKKSFQQKPDESKENKQKDTKKE